MEFKGTKNWRIRRSDGFFFIEADLPNAEQNGNYPRIEVMQEDYGDHNGYTEEIRSYDAQLISKSQQMLDFINRLSGEMLRNDFVLNEAWYDQAQQLIRSATQI
ncbi:hypothetical protein [Sphingobacterium corticibacter]|uniref:Uncharacterized protein n=1 Tax=Sphingobacterium corticibacter TaxID=2171749 RepID=A0A2T8HNI4_9SPHI|nr:hypothetical protein [Sphingobacterium corticibacter]PVH26975.1 hypothetical protein DC487_05110 [Sphingobacterium corticibacter]